MALNVEIDNTRCVGHGRCYMVSPEQFEADEVDKGRVRRPLGDDDLEGVELAIDSCPEQAISLVASD